MLWLKAERQKVTNAHVLYCYIHNKAPLQQRQAAVVLEALQFHCTQGSSPGEVDFSSRRVFLYVRKLVTGPHSCRNAQSQSANKAFYTGEGHAGGEGQCVLTEPKMYGGWVSESSWFLVRHDVVT